MSDGVTTVHSLIARLLELGHSPETIAAHLVLELRDELKRNIHAGRGPDGTPWKPTQAGTPALRNAGAALEVSARGTTITAQLAGVEARHHYGTVRGGVARPILPSRELPQQIAALVTRVAQQRFRAVMKGSADG